MIHWYFVIHIFQHLVGRLLQLSLVRPGNLRSLTGFMMLALDCICMNLVVLPWYLKTISVSPTKSQQKEAS